MKYTRFSLMAVVFSQVRSTCATMDGYIIRKQKSLKLCAAAPTAAVNARGMGIAPAWGTLTSPGLCYTSSSVEKRMKNPGSLPQFVHVRLAGGAGPGDPSLPAVGVGNPSVPTMACSSITQNWRRYSEFHILSNIYVCTYVRMYMHTHIHTYMYIHAFFWRS